MTERRLIALTDSLDAAEPRLMDAHNHLWIGRVADAVNDAPVLADYGKAERDLLQFKQACLEANLPVGIQVDCQPGGFGRNALVLRRLSLATGVPIIACTGFHLRRYSQLNWVWDAPTAMIRDHFVRELTVNLQEAPDDEPMRAGFIKIAFETDTNQTPPNLLDAVAEAVLQTGCAVQIHTERGESAKRILALFAVRQVPMNRLILCHMDKRPDAALHRDLIAQGALLEYDTFFRPKYDPEKNAFPLLRTMIESGHTHGIALATDMAYDANGMASIITTLRQRLKSEGVDEGTILQIMGGNIAARLARND